MLASYTHRGVTYSVRVLPGQGTKAPVELSVNGVVTASGELTVRVDGPLLGGSEREATTIYTALERELCRLLER